MYNRVWTQSEIVCPRFASVMHTCTPFCTGAVLRLLTQLARSCGAVQCCLHPAWRGAWRRIFVWTQSGIVCCVFYILRIVPVNRGFIVSRWSDMVLTRAQAATGYLAPVSVKSATVVSPAKAAANLRRQHQAAVDRYLAAKYRAAVLFIDNSRCDSAAE